MRACARGPVAHPCERRARIRAAARASSGRPRSETRARREARGAGLVGAVGARASARAAACAEPQRRSRAAICAGRACAPRPSAVLGVETTAGIGRPEAARSRAPTSRRAACRAGTARARTKPAAPLATAHGRAAPRRPAPSRLVSAPTAVTVAGGIPGARRCHASAVSERLKSWRGGPIARGHVRRSNAALHAPRRGRRLRPPPEGPAPAADPRRRRAAPRSTELPSLTPRGHRGRASTRCSTTRPSSREFAEENEVDFSYVDPGRRALPRQRLPPARLVVDRLPRDPARDPHDRRAQPAAGHPRARRGGARDHPADRHDRLGQVDDARRDDRPHQRNARPRTSSRSRTRSSSCTSTSSSIINQREVGLDTHSFKRALRRVLRQDPDVILIGEMRDEETVHTALSRRRDRPPRAVDGPHRRRRRDRQPHHRLLPAAHAPAGRARCSPARSRASSPSASCRPTDGGRVRDLRDPAHDRPRARHDHGPDADRPAHRGHRRGRLLRHADLRPGALRARQGRPRRRSSRRSRPRRARTTSSCCSRPTARRARRWPTSRTSPHGARRPELHLVK